MIFLVVRGPKGARALNLDHVHDLRVSEDGRTVRFYSSPVGMRDGDGSAFLQQHEEAYFGDEAAEIIRLLNLAPTDADTMDVFLCDVAETQPNQSVCVRETA